MPTSERQGIFWWELDITHYVLKVLSWFHLVWDLKKPPQNVYALTASQKIRQRKTAERHGHCSDAHNRRNKHQSC